MSDRDARIGPPTRRAWKRRKTPGWLRLIGAPVQAELRLPDSVQLALPFDGVIPGSWRGVERMRYQCEACGGEAEIGCAYCDGCWLERQG